MSSNGSETKRRRQPINEDAILEPSTKKVKVQAQRKFAQNAVTPVSSTQKPVQTLVVPSNSTKPPIKRPNTEDFLTFLCFRGTNLLPARLDFFNKPQRSAQDAASGKKRRKSTPILPVTNANSLNSEPNERKITQLPPDKYLSTKTKEIGKKVGRNHVRSNARYTVRQETLTLRQLSLHHGSKVTNTKPKVKKPPVEVTVKKETKKKKKQVSLDGNKKIQKIKGRITRSNSLPSLFCPAFNQLRDVNGKWCKGSTKTSSSKTSEDSRDVEEERPSRKKTVSKNLDHRSNSVGNMKQKNSEVKCKVGNKNNRKTRSLASKHRNSDQDNYVVPEKKSDKNLKTVSKSNKANSLVETKLMVDKKRRTSSVDNMKTHEIKDSTSVTRSRPPRRTKEAATLFMEMLKKDMRCPDEQDEDDTSSVESFPDLPNTRINEQRERELVKVFPKNKMEKHLEEPQQSNDNKNEQSSLLASDIKKTAVDKKKVKEKKKNEVKIMPAKKNSKEELETIVMIENGGITSFRRNLRPRRSSTMLDDYIMTDSEEDDQKPETIIEVKKLDTSKSSMSKAQSVEEDLKSQKNKLSAEESGKKNLKINKTDLKPKKDLSKIDSEVKKSLSDTKSKNNSILLKRDKEPEIKNSKSTAAVDKKNEKSSKNKTETVGITTTKEPKTATGEGSKNAGKKVPPSSKQQQSTSKKDIGSNKKKSNLDLFNNNKKQPSSTVTSSASSSSSMFSSVTSQTKEDLLEHMAANFVAKPTDNASGDGSTAERNEVVDAAARTKSVNHKVENRKGGAVVAGEGEKKPVRPGQKELMKTEKVVVSTKAENVGKVENAVAVGKTEKAAVVAGKVKNVVAAGKVENPVAAEKMKNAIAVEKVENAIAAGKVENVVAMVVGKMEKTESLLAAATPFEQVENMVAFKTLAQDLLLGQQKEIKINIPQYFADKSFQLPNRFKHNDGLSVLSEICSALPRYNEPYVSNRQLLDKLPTVVTDCNGSYALKYPQSQPALPPPPPQTVISGDDKKEEKPVAVPPSFESRTMKMVNLARSNGSLAVSVSPAPVTSAAGTNEKKDLTASWRQAFKNVKLPKNGLTSTAVSIGSNLMAAWTKKKQSGDNNQIPLPDKFLTNGVDKRQQAPAESSLTSHACQKISCSESKTAEVFSDGGGSGKKLPVPNSSYLAKTTILNSTKYDLKFEKRFSPVAVASAVVTAAPVDKQSLQRKDVVADVISSSDDQSPEKKIFHQRRLSTTQSCSGNSSDAFSPDNETSVYAFEPDLPVASTPFRRNKPQSPAKSRTVSPNTSIAVSIENDSTEEKSHQSTVSSSTDADSEEGRLFYIPLPAGVQAQPLIQGVTVKLGTEGPQNKLVMSAKLVTKPPASTIPVSSISPKPAHERKIKPLCSTKITNSTTPVGTVQPTTRTVQPPKSTPSTSKQVLPLPPQLQIPDTKDVKKHLQQITTTTATTITTTSTTTLVKESKKSSVSSLSSSSSAADNKKTKKTEKQVINNKKRKSSEKVASKKKSLKEQAVMLDAPTFYPSEEDFKDPLDYFEIIKPVAQKYGICRVVPPASFKPECKVTDDMRFTAYNQYVHKMMNRWGPNVREMIAMKKYLETQSIVLSNPPLIGGMELDLPRLYHTVQELGGLKEVIELDKWCRVADLMKIPKSAQDRVTKLDDIYCKYLLPYDTLSHDERQKLIAEVDKEWKQICKKGDTEDDLFDGVNDCIAKGRNIALSAYYRVARNTVAMWFKEQQQQPMSGRPSTSTKLGAAAVRAEDVESFYWKQVQEKKNHICVLSGSIDSGAEGYGFPTTKNATFTKHPWNLKVLTNNSVSVLKSLGPVMGMTVPTIHMGMVFSACCWYRDPHGLPWIEYLHTGADKVWYGVPADQSDRFRAAMKRLLPRAVAEGKNHHTWLAADSGMVPPDRLLEHGVTLTRTVQNPGQFLIVMPRAYTCNVSTGYVISESVYFTQLGWLNGAEKIFRDLQKNCEPAAFSFEKLLINMSTDSRTPFSILKQLLNLLSNMRDCEVALRSQLVEDLGLKASERIRPPSKSVEQNEDYECDVCHSILYISMVNNSHEDCDYCLRHGIEHLSKKHNQLKYCKFLYNFDETELDSILVKLRERIDSKKKKSSIKS